MSITAIIPIFKPDVHRRRNLDFISPKLSKCVDELVIVEQGKLDYEVGGLACPHSHIVVKSNKSVIEKSRLINVGLNRCRSDWVVVHDADIYFPFKVLRSLPDFDFIKPFRFFVRLSEEQSQEFVNKGKLVLPKVPATTNLVAGSFVMRREKLVSMRGMNEDFVGWGWEDNELEARVMKCCTVGIMGGLVGTHLWHPPAFTEESMNLNQPLFVESSRRIAADVKGYIRGMRSSVK